MKQTQLGTLWALALCWALLPLQAQATLSQDAPPAQAETIGTTDPVGTVAEPMDPGHATHPAADRTVAEGIAATASEAVQDTAAVAKNTGVQVTEQGRKVWQEALMPMGQRLAAAFPSLLKAFLLLLAFWIGASILGSVVTRLLLKTDVDNRLAKDWGLDQLMAGKGQKDAFEQTAGTVVKWVILLFGFVAFFNALDLGMVASPLQNVLNKITGSIPTVLSAAVILLGYWLVATVVRFVVTKGLGAVGFDNRVAKWVPAREIDGQQVGPSITLGRLLFYIILLIGIPPFLEALGQQALVKPLSDMFSEVFAFLPNILAAVILLFIGKIIATIVKEVITNLLAASGVDSFAERFGFGKSEETKKVSDIAGAISFFFVIIPIIVAAVDSLQIDAISGPVKGTLERLMNAIPLLLVAIVVVAIGLFIARAVRGIVQSFLSGVGFDALPAKVGLRFLEPKEGQASLSSIAGTVIMAVILLLTTEQALATLQLTELSTLVGSLVSYLPSLVVGVAIILVGLSLGNYVSGLLDSILSASPHRALVSAVARYAIIFLTFSMGLNQLGVGQEIIVIAVSAVLGGAALGLGLAFGLGGQQKAREIIERNTTSS
ncbi:MAG: mechanosensitive ion channel [Deltaproteobacteria bacterium]|nr:mechanosensitive ion channel [Deltaproteobacteria bacterium]